MCDHTGQIFQSIDLPEANVVICHAYFTGFVESPILVESSQVAFNLSDTTITACFSAMCINLEAISKIHVERLCISHCEFSSRCCRFRLSPSSINVKNNSATMMSGFGLSILSGYVFYFDRGDVTSKYHNFSDVTSPTYSTYCHTSTGFADISHITLKMVSAEIPLQFGGENVDSASSFNLVHVTTAESLIRLYYYVPDVTIYNFVFIGCVFSQFYSTYTFIIEPTLFCSGCVIDRMDSPPNGVVVSRNPRQIVYDWYAPGSCEIPTDIFSRLKQVKGRHSIPIIMANLLMYTINV